MNALYFMLGAGAFGLGYWVLKHHCIHPPRVRILWIPIAVSAMLFLYSSAVISTYSEFSGPLDIAMAILGAFLAEVFLPSSLLFKRRNRSQMS